MKKISKMKSSKLGSSTMSSNTLNGANKAKSSNSLNTIGVGTNSLLNQQIEESNLKILRELSHVEGNRYCFDCGQRGPSYVNVTIGSFVCMTCSGLLRGLTPPHRVKSISMASFTQEEMELLKTRGNEYCRRVWLATHTAKDTQLNSSDPDKLNCLKSHLSAKYEQKRYWVDPSRLSKLDLLEIKSKNSLTGSSSNLHKSPSISSNCSSSPSPLLNSKNRGGTSSRQMSNSITLPDIKPLSSLLDPSLTPSLNLLSSDLSSLSLSQQHNGTQQFGTSIAPPPLSNKTQNIAQENGKITLASDDSSANFADFDDAFNNAGKTNGNGFEADFLSPKLTNGGFANFNEQQRSDGAMNGKVNTHSNLGESKLNGSSKVNGEDKYAALKDLDSLFKSTNNSSGDVGGNVFGSPPQQQLGLSNSMSVPINLSSSSISPKDSTTWFTHTPPIHNPFSVQQQGTSGVNGWSACATAANGSMNMNNGGSGHNPFFGNANAWGSQHHSNGQYQSQREFVNGGATPPSHSSFPSSISFTNGLNISYGSKQAMNPNPFYQKSTLPVSHNPNNPFL